MLCASGRQPRWPPVEPRKTAAGRWLTSLRLCSEKSFSPPRSSAKRSRPRSIPPLVLPHPDNSQTQSMRESSPPQIWPRCVCTRSLSGLRQEQHLTNPPANSCDASLAPLVIWRRHFPMTHPSPSTNAWTRSQMCSSGSVPSMNQFRNKGAVTPYCPSGFISSFPKLALSTPHSIAALNGSSLSNLASTKKTQKTNRSFRMCSVEPAAKLLSASVSAAHDSCRVN